MNSLNARGHHKIMKNLLFIGIPEHEKHTLQEFFVELLNKEYHIEYATNENLTEILIEGADRVVFFRDYPY